MAWAGDWSAHAACRTADPDEMFVEGVARNRSKTVCTGCEVRTECLADALDNRVESGVWGGLTVRERRALLLRRPAVASWRRFLETARTEYEAAGGHLDLAEPSSWLSGEEEAAFVIVFRERFVPLVGFLIKAGASRQDAEDSAQNAFVALAKSLRDVGHPNSWLRKTAFRMWLKLVHRIRPDELTDQIPERAEGDHGDDVTQKLALVQLLRRLPPLQRTVMAFDIDGCTPSETAEALDVPAANVRQNLRRARARLERLLDEDEGGQR